MQRRNVGTTATPAGVVAPSYGQASVNNTTRRPLLGGSPSRARRSEGSPLFTAPVLVGIAVLITVATYMFPEEAVIVEREAEEIAHRAYQAEQELEKEMMDWWHEDRTVKEPAMTDEAMREYTSERMAKQTSKWVDGEKQLKLKLKELVELQKQGKEIGTPVLTRWLGEDIPAFAGEGVNKEEWEKKIEESYDRMRKEEEEWRQAVSAILEKENRG